MNTADSESQPAGRPRVSGGGARVAIVEDDAVVGGVVSEYLQSFGYTVDHYNDGLSAKRALRSGMPDIVVLDRMLPGMSGDELLRHIRRVSDVPVIMLTALGSTGARIDGLERGADDYLGKPFALKELELRMQTLLRRRRESEPLAAFRAGPFRIDPAQRRVTRDDSEIVLTAREYELLLFFLKNPDKVFTREEILRDVWGWDFGEPSTVTVHVRRLREKIEIAPETPDHLLTVWGAGYRFTANGGLP